MIRRDFLKVIGAGIFAAAMPGIFAKDATAARRKPNIVFIHIDDMGWNDVGCYGADFFETPNIDKLAGKGMRFTQGYASCTVCSPTRASLMTGRYPARTGITDYIRPSKSTTNPTGYDETTTKEYWCPNLSNFMDPSEITIAEILKQAGYTTCHIGKWHLGGEHAYPDMQGFDYNIGGCHWGMPLGSRKPNPQYFDPYECPTLKDRTLGEYLTDREVDEATDFMANMVQTNKLFYLQLAHYAVHGPIQAKQELIDKYEAKKNSQSWEFNYSTKYAAMIESVDQSVGKVLDKLDELKIADNTVVFFASDNGGVAGRSVLAPLRGSKTWAYEGGIRSPWLVRWPRVIKPGSTCAEPIISMDFFPTVCEIIHQPLPDNREIDGLSLVPLLKQTGSLNRDALIWHFPHYKGDAYNKAPHDIILSDNGKWKLIRFYSNGITHELFNLGDDIGESNNLVAADPARVQAMDAELTIRLAQMGAMIPKPNPNYTG